MCGLQFKTKNGQIYFWGLKDGKKETVTRVNELGRGLNVAQGDLIDYFAIYMDDADEIRTARGALEDDEDA